MYPSEVMDLPCVAMKSLLFELYPWNAQALTIDNQLYTMDVALYGKSRWFCHPDNCTSLGWVNFWAVEGKQFPARSPRLPTS